MKHGFQITLLVGALALVFQFDAGVRQWEGEALRAMADAASTLFSGSEPPPQARMPSHGPRLSPHKARPSTAHHRRHDGDCPARPMVGHEAEFPGPGWYRVKCWRAWFPEEHFQCLETTYKYLTNEDEWRDMYWGNWDHEAGPEVAADARMHTTDGVRRALFLPEYASH